MATARKVTKKVSKAAPKKAVKKVSKRITPKAKPKAKAEERIVYKAFKKEDGKLVSASMQGVFRLSYPIGKKTASPAELLKLGYGIMVFETLEEAQSWIGCKGENCPSHAVLAVKAGEVFNPPAKRLHRNVLGHYEGLFKPASKPNWRGIASRLLKSLDVEDNWPTGSLMANYVIPIED